MINRNYYASTDLILSKLMEFKPEALSVIFSTGQYPKQFLYGNNKMICCQQLLSVVSTDLIIKQQAL